MASSSERPLVSRRTWLSDLGGLNQDETSAQPGLMHARVDNFSSGPTPKGLCR